MQKAISSESSRLNFVPPYSNDCTLPETSDQSYLGHFQNQSKLWNWRIISTADKTSVYDDFGISEYLDNSNFQGATSLITIEKLEKRLLDLINSSQEETFEDGIANSLNSGIRKLLPIYKESLLYSIDKLAGEEKNPPPAHALAEIIRTLDEASRFINPEKLLSFFSKYAYHSSVLVRDSAVMALVTLGGSRAYNELEKVRDIETETELRKEIETLLQELTDDNQLHLHYAV